MKIIFKKTCKVAKYYGIEGEMDVKEGEIFIAQTPDDLRYAKIWVNEGIADHVECEEHVEDASLGDATQNQQEATADQDFESSQEVVIEAKKNNPKKRSRRKKN